MAIYGEQTDPPKYGSPIIEAGPGTRPYEVPPKVSVADQANVPWTGDSPTAKKKPVHRENWGDFVKLLAAYHTELSIQEAERRRMAEDERFKEGDQWSENDKVELEKRGQLPICYNVIQPTVDWVLGNQRSGRMESKVLPKTKHARKAAERKSKLMKHLADQNMSSLAVTQAFRDAVTVGLGWLETGFQDDEDGERVFSRMESWRNIVFDSRASKFCLSDARYMFRAKWVDLDVAISMAPKAEVILRQAAQTAYDTRGTNALGDMGDEAMDAREDQAEDWLNTREDFGHTRQRVKLVEAWYRRPMKVQVLKGGRYSGEIYDPHSERQWLELAEGRARLVHRNRMIMHVGIFCEHGFITHQKSPYSHNKFPFTPVWGNRKGHNGMPYGLVRAMRDIQVDINKRASKALHILSTNKILADEGAVPKGMTLEEWAEEASRPDSILFKKKGHEVILNAERELAGAHMEIFQLSIGMIQELSGVTDEAMGRTTNAVSGKAIMARQTQGSMQTLHFFDNLRFAQRIHGAKELSNIEQFYTDEYEFRITNERGTPEYIEINQGDEESDILLSKDDFTISEIEWNATQRQQSAQMFIEAMGKVGAAGGPLLASVIDLLAESLDMPNGKEIVARIRQQTGLEDPDADPNDLDEEAQARKAARDYQAEMQKRAAEAEIRGAEAKANLTEAQTMKARTDGLKNAQAIGQGNIQMIVDALQAAIEMLNARPAAPVADTIYSQAQAAGIQALGAAVPTPGDTPDMSPTPQPQAPMQPVPA